MDIPRKIEIVETALDSLAGHTCEDSIVLIAALDRAAELVAEKKAALLAQIQSRASELLG